MSKTLTITIPHLTNAECGDLAVTAAEGGINYWGECKNYKWSEWYVDVDAKYGDENYNKLKEDLPEDFVYVYVREEIGRAHV